MAGGGGENVNTSVFRIGDNVELWRVLLMMSVLVLVVVVFERGLHTLEHHVKKYPKYHDMMTKVFGELMILGLIGLGIKILKELGQLNPYSDTMIAFQAADLTVFLVAIALVIQATVVFVRIRRKNIQVDKAELISTQHLVDTIARTQMPTWFHEFRTMFTYTRTRAQNRQGITEADIPEVAKLRILRHYFLKSYGLPELFPFAKYLRQAQDNQISHMIDVEMSTWIILLVIAWALEAVARAVTEQYYEMRDDAKDHSNDHDHDDDDDDDASKYYAKRGQNYSIVVAFVLFSWMAVLLHIAISTYLTWAIDKLLYAAVVVPATPSESHHVDRYLYLNEIADQEAQISAQEVATDAIAVMERVRKHERRKRIQRTRSKISEHDTGFQLVASVFRSISSRRMQRKPRTEAPPATAAVAECEEGIPTTAPVSPPPQTRGQPINLRWFSRKAWHFLIMSTLMLNALYVALFCQCVLFQMQSIAERFGGMYAMVLPLPLVLNMVVFQPRILRNFILVSSIFRVDDTALGDVIDHFTHTVQLRAGFVETVHAHLESTQQTLADIQLEFERVDVEHTGLLDADDVRRVLKRFGFKLSYFRFNSVAKLLFNLNGIAIEYAQVMRLLELGRSDQVRSFAASTTSSGSFVLLESYRSGDASLCVSHQSNPIHKPRSSAARLLSHRELALQF